MGVAETWRGRPDCRLRGLALDSDVPVLLGRSNEDAGSDGTSTVCEAKLEINKQRNLGQIVKTCVVASFIESNLHPDLNTMIPTILIDTKQAMVVLYCSKHDLLLVSDVFTWREYGKFCVPGITFLWTMINHRYEIVIFWYEIVIF